MKIDIENYTLLAKLKGRTKYFPVEKVFVNTCQVRVKERENVWNTVDLSFVTDWKLSKETTQPEQEYKPKYKVGDKVKVFNRECGHSFAIGEIVTLKTQSASHSWRCSNGRDSWELHEDEFEPYTEPEKEPEPEYYNGKVVCVNDGGWPEYWTVGRVYTVNNGTVCYDTNERSYIQIKSLEHMNDKHCAKFIEYKGEA